MSLDTSQALLIVLDDERFGKERAFFYKSPVGRSKKLLFCLTSI
jgi:hypothetical protein